MPELTENARVVLETRYLARVDGKVVETAEELFRRVARHIAAVEGTVYGKDPGEVAAWEQRFYRMLSSLEALPNSPCLMNAGRELGQLSACFVLPVADSIEAIFDSIKHAALIQRSGGGTGFAFSRLRPKNDVVRSTGGIASGPVSFLKCFNAATEAIKQGGTRRGANMGILRVDHPDILEFITCKADGRDITNFNLSVAVTDDFMHAVEGDEEYDLINPRCGGVAGRLRAKDVFGRMVEMAWKNGEPGVIFLDRINRDNPTPERGAIESTNPCGEQPLLPYESCVLASVNLARMVERGAVDHEKLREVVHLAVRFLDNVIDANRYSLPEIEQATLRTRKIGLGIMGFADLLIRLGIAYDSEQAVSLAGEIMRFIQSEARRASEELARERGPFPDFSRSIYARGAAVRNATRTTIAPTGTLSIIAGCASGCEPLFAVAFHRKVLDGKVLTEVNPLFLAMARERGFYSKELMERISRAGTVKAVEGVPEDVARLFVCAHEVAPEWHLRIQAAFQEHVDNAVSKTVNLPREATAADVGEAFVKAHRLGLKGLTIYRYGSRDEQVLNIGTTAGDAAAKPLPAVAPQARPDVLAGRTRRVITPSGTLWLTANEHAGRPFEVFATIGRAGSDLLALTEAIARMISLGLRCGLPLERITEQLIGIGGSRSVGFGTGRVLSVPDAIGKALAAEYLNSPNGTPSGPPPANQVAIFGICPACGNASLVQQEGCIHCVSCSFTEC
ncbi:MAG TPA: vitamin B12-dependent ribonucleotide reductase [Bacillota bacterium]|nr:vitamin B12-dependent ribonucleotide reductase [Bacillota bacterium]